MSHNFMVLTKNGSAFFIKLPKEVRLRDKFLQPI
jgi:hypothetical protein